MGSITTQRVLSREQHALNQAVFARMLDDPAVAGLDALVESDQDGNLIVSPPPSKRHSHRQSRILLLLTRLLPAGVALAEYPVSTPEGIKAPDVVWLSPERAGPPQDESLDDHAPDICIEVMSPANSPRQTRAKVAAYFAAGAREVWVCDLTGSMLFYAAGRKLGGSQLCPDFPREVLPS